MADRPDLVQDLKGHSGCKVQLLRFGESYIVRKISASPDYNLRLTRQIEKQRRLVRIAPVARVLATGMDDGLVSFDMEYVAGRDLAAQCLQEPPAWVFAFVERLFAVLGDLSANAVAGRLDGRFVEKVREIESRLSTHPLAESCRTTIGRAIAALREADWSAIPCTECHGDLTLENIIFQSDGSLVLIDVLDGDLETVWLDIAKLLFDLDVGWTLRDILWADRGPAHGGRLLEIFSRYLSEQILSRVTEHYPDLLARLPQFKILQAMRILPYTHDRTTFNRLAAFLDATNPSEGHVT